MKDFLEVTTDQANSQTDDQLDNDIAITANDWTETDSYDFNHYSEMDANDQAGNVDTLVDDADI